MNLYLLLAFAALVRSEEDHNTGLNNENQDPTVVLGKESFNVCAENCRNSHKPSSKRIISHSTPLDILGSCCSRPRFRQVLRTMVWFAQFCTFRTRVKAAWIIILIGHHLFKFSYQLLNLNLLQISEMLG
jgi:hypothetical protein